MMKRSSRVFLWSLLVVVGCVLTAPPAILAEESFESLMGRIKWTDNIVERLSAKEWAPPAGWEFVADKVKEITWINAGAMKWDPAILVHQEKFEKKTGIKVKNIVVPDSALNTKTTSMLSAKSGAGVSIHMSPASNVDYFRAGWIQDISQMWNDESKALYAPAAVFNNSYKGRMYAVPAMGRTHQLLYRKDLLKKYCGTDKAPETWQELVDFGKKLTIDENGDGNPDIWGFVYYGHKDALAWQIQQFTHLQGKKSEELVDDKGVPRYDTPEAVRALQFLTDLVKEYKITPAGVVNYWDTDILTMFTAGKVAMLVCNNWVNFKLLKDKENWPAEKWGIARLPKCGGWGGGPDGAHYPRIDAYSAAINVYADPFQKVAAALYLDCVRSFESNKDEQVVEQNLALMPMVYGDPEVQEKTYGFDLMKWSLENSQGITYQQAYTSYMILMEFGAKAILGEMSPKEAMDKAQKRIEAGMWF